MSDNLPMKREASDVQKSPRSVAEILKRPDIADTLRTAASNAIDGGRLLSIVLGEIRRTPKLLKCKPESFYSAVIEVAKLGLVPGHTCHLIPYGAECQMQVNYRGLLQLARRSGEIRYIAPHAVYEGDEFGYRLGLHPDLTHVPSPGKRGQLTHVYAVCKLASGETDFEVMTAAEVDSVRGRNNSPAWRDYYGEMARKTVLKRLLKRLPFSADVHAAIEREDSCAPTVVLAPDTTVDVDATLLAAESDLPTTPEDAAATTASAAAEAMKAKK